MLVPSQIFSLSLDNLVQIRQVFATLAINVTNVSHDLFATHLLHAHRIFAKYMYTNIDKYTDTAHGKGADVHVKLIRST